MDVSDNQLQSQQKQWNNTVSRQILKSLSSQSFCKYWGFFLWGLHINWGFISGGFSVVDPRGGVISGVCTSTGGVHLRGLQFGGGGSSGGGGNLQGGILRAVFIE